jgi:hypothetical protein
MDVLQCNSKRHSYPHPPKLGGLLPTRSEPYNLHAHIVLHLLRAGHGDCFEHLLRHDCPRRDCWLAPGRSAASKPNRPVDAGVAAVASLS